MCNANAIGMAGLGLQVAGGIGGSYASYRKSVGEQQGYEYQSTVARNNAQLAEWQAQDAMIRGARAEGDVRLKTAQVSGAQRSVLAARNVAMDEGSALSILADTEFMGERDARTVADNTANEAWALRMQAQGYKSNADVLASRARAQSPVMDAGGTLLSTAGKVASSWYALRKSNTVSIE